MNTTTNTIAVNLSTGMQTIPALRVEGGLALHKDVNRPTFWSISHAPSGLSVWDKCARSKADAMARFDALLALTDWNRPQQDLVREPDLHNRIRVLRQNPPSAPRPEQKSRPPLRVATRTSQSGKTFETPVWWEEEGLSVEGDPKKGLVITHEASGLRVVSLPRRVSRTKAIRLAKTFLDVGKAHGMEWTQKNPFPSSGVPSEFRRLVQEAEQGF